MELVNQPATEEEYWQAIEALGGYIYYSRHDLRQNFTIDKDGQIAEDIQQAKAIQERLCAEIAEKFGIDSDKYWNWYKSMKRQVLEATYNDLICSACPLSEGLEAYLSTHTIPCKPFRGMLYLLQRPWQCAMITQGERMWSEGYLMRVIRKVGGANAVTNFEQKKAELKSRT